MFGIIGAIFAAACTLSLVYKCKKYSKYNYDVNEKVRWPYIRHTYLSKGNTVEISVIKTKNINDKETYEYCYLDSSVIRGYDPREYILFSDNYWDVLFPDQYNKGRYVRLYIDFGKPEDTDNTYYCSKMILEHLYESEFKQNYLK